MICNTKLMVQSTLFVTENTLFVNQITQNTLFTAFMVTVTDGWQIHNLDNMILGQLKIGERQATAQWYVHIMNGETQNYIEAICI